MATITKTYPTDQMNYWSTGISIPAGQYISSISIHCDYGYNQASSYVALYIDGKQLATIAPNLLGAVNGSVSGTITGTTISANQNTFSFRAEVTITYTLASYAVARSISKTVSPSGAGSFTVKKNGSEVSSAYKNDSIAVAASANSGYVFKNWSTSPANLISASTTASTSFTMPDQNVTITAEYWKISTGTLNKTSMEGGSTVVLTITAQSSSLSHKYNLSFGTGMATGDVSVAAGTSSVNISVPLNWSGQIPNATSASGTLTLKTYNGSTLIGSTTISNLTYKVPASVIPSIGTITTSIARTIGGTTYANIGNYYVQNHCGVRVQASATGNQNATIATMKVNIGSFAGSNYKFTESGNSIDITSGLLDKAGTCNIKVEATDSRGRTATKTETITVTAYSQPSGSLSVWRVNSGGTTDDFGVYGKYSLTKQYSAIGNNNLTCTLSVSGSSATNPATTGDLLPDNKKQFTTTQEYTVTMTLTDSFHTATITAKVQSARFILAFDSTGNRIGLMKFPNKTIPSGKNRTFEISADTQIYMGDDKLPDFTTVTASATLESTTTADGITCYKYGQICYIYFDYVKTSHSGSGFFKIATLPSGIVPKFEQHGLLYSSTDYASRYAFVTDVKVATNGNISMKLGTSNSQVRHYGGFTFICE